MATYKSIRYKFDGSALTNAGWTGTPAFAASNITGDSGWTEDTNHLVTMTQEHYDSDGCFNATGSTVTLNSLSVPAYSFCPNVAGRYYSTFYYTGDSGAVDNLLGVNGKVHFNGNNGVAMAMDYPCSYYAASSREGHALIQAIHVMNGTGDYLTPYLSVDNSNSGTVSLLYENDPYWNMFSAFRLD
jgi:hypothetical protein